MIAVTDLRAGTTYKEDNDIFVVLSYDHIKMGRGSANVKVKVRNLRSNATVEKSFMSGASVDDVVLTNMRHQFLYKDDANAFFMNEDSFEQLSIPLKNLAGHEFLQEGEQATLQFYGDDALGLMLPPKVNLTIADTAPGVKGNSASNVYKDAELDNGMKIRVPLFINVGDVVSVDTRDGSYTRRV